MYYYLLDESGYLKQEITEDQSIVIGPSKFYASEIELALELTWDLSDFKCKRWNIFNGELIESEIVTRIKLDENLFIFDALVDSISYFEADKMLTYEQSAILFSSKLETETLSQSLRQKWPHGDYQCWKWKLDESLVQSSIKKYAVVTNGFVSKSIVISDLEKSVLDSGGQLDRAFSCTIETLPEGTTDVELTNAQAIEIATAKTPVYKIIDGAVTPVLDSEIIEQLREIKGVELFEAYISEITPHDDWEMYYPKELGLIELEGTAEQVAALNARNVLATEYWRECRRKRIENKASLATATTKAQVDAITFNVVHAVSWEDI